MISKWSNLILFAHLEGFNNYFSIQVQSIDIKFNNVFKRLNLFCDQFQNTTSHVSFGMMFLNKLKLLYN